MDDNQYYYCRVSSKGQDYEGQVEQARKMGIPEKNIYKEKMTGTSKSRPEYQALLRRVKDEPGTIWVRDLTRWGRSLQDAKNGIEYLRENGSALKTMDGMVDTRSKEPMKEAFLHLMLTFAQLDRDFIADRLEQGRIRAAANENYREGRKPKFSPEEVAALQERYLTGELPTELARDLDVSVSTVRRALGLNREASTYTKSRTA